MNDNWDNKTNHKETKPAIHIENLSVYYGQNAALTNICLDIAEGEYLGIIGPNGGGKTTLLRAILGLVPVRGTVLIHGEAPGKTVSSIGYVPQINALNRQFPITVLEVVLTGRLSAGLSPLFPFFKRRQRYRSRAA